MGILRTLVVGALGYAAYRAWQRRNTQASESSQTASLRDHGSTTAPHGDPLIEDAREEPAFAAGAQASRSFGTT